MKLKRRTNYMKQIVLYQSRHLRSFTIAFHIDILFMFTCGGEVVAGLLTAKGIDFKAKGFSKLSTVPLRSNTLEEFVKPSPQILRQKIRSPLHFFP
jgi:hypothetical protein